MKEIKMDLNNQAQQLIIAALAMLVEDEGYTPREAYQLLEVIKRESWSGLSQIHSEVNK